MRLERAVAIAREPDAVWAVLRDPALMPQWFDGFENFQALDGDGTNAGDHYRIDFMRDSGPVELRVAVLSVDPPNGHTHRFEGLPAAFEFTSELLPNGDSTTWSATIEVKLSLIQRTLAPVVRGYLDELADNMSEGFKSFVEAQ